MKNIVITDSINLDTELEYKFDIPLINQPHEFIENIDKWVLDEWWIIMNKFVEKRHFTYFDTLSNKIYDNNWTLRCVSPAGEKSTFYRYDFKLWEIWTEGRKEWSFIENDPVLDEVLLQKFNLTDILGELKKDIEADTCHIKRKIMIWSTILEITFDIFYLDNGQIFQELEIELEKGSPEVLIDFKNRLKKHFWLKEIFQQKYSRIKEEKRGFNEKLIGLVNQIL